MANLLNPELALVQGGRRVVRWLRRLATRVLLVQVHAELAELRRRQDRLERRLHALLGMRYDGAAVAGRLAALEDCVRRLQPAEERWDDRPLPRKG